MASASSEMALMRVASLVMALDSFLVESWLSVTPAPGWRSSEPCARVPGARSIASNPSRNGLDSDGTRDILPKSLFKRLCGAPEGRPSQRGHGGMPDPFRPVEYGGRGLKVQE